MPRSLWKGPFVDAFMSKWKQTDTKIKSRGSVILPDFVGKTVQIHNGQKFMALKITEEMIGHKFGEFSSTRKVGDKPKKGKK